MSGHEREHDNQYQVQYHRDAEAPGQNYDPCVVGHSSV